MSKSVTRSNSETCTLGVTKPQQKGEIELLTEKLSKQIANQLNKKGFTEEKTPYLLRQFILAQLITKVQNAKLQKIYELGTVIDYGQGCEENTHISIVISHPKARFEFIKKFIHDLFYKNNIKYRLQTPSLSCFIKNRNAKLILKNQTIGHIGQITYRILQELNCEGPVVAAEINLSKLAKLLI